MRLVSLSLFFAMSIVFVQPSVFAPAVFAGPSPGPRTPQEANFLYQEGQESLASGNRKQATLSFEKFRARYPSDPRVLEATIALVQNYAALDQPKKVIQVGKDVLHLKPNLEQTIIIKEQVMLGYFQLDRCAETLLFAEEIIKEKKLDSAMKAKLECLLKQERITAAETLLEDLKMRASDNKDVELALFLETQEHRIRAKKCDLKKFVLAPKTKDSPSNSSKDGLSKEDQLLRYFTEKRLCFEEVGAKEACPSIQALKQELKKSPLDQYAQKKILSEIKSGEEILNCNDSH